MVIRNVQIYTTEKRFEKGTILIRDGIFERIILNGEGDVSFDLSESVLDGQGCYAIPGLVDMHLHGAMGADFCDGSLEAIQGIAEYEASIGVTAMACATMTLPQVELEQVLEVGANYVKESHLGADLVGINMEGPFISPMKKGAQEEKNILPCDEKLCERFIDVSEGLVKVIGIAPEESEKSLSFIQQMKDVVGISLAHTDADYDTAKRAIDAGVNHVTHLFNAMPEFNHRQPGVVGAVADCDEVMAELICDGVHVHPAMIRAAFKMIGEERIILISDSMRATGLLDGTYTLGGQDVVVTGNEARLKKDGTLAGSVTNLMDCMRKMVDMGIPLETAVACVTANPARSLHIENEYGMIKKGYRGNLVLLDEELEIKRVIKDGNVIPKRFEM